MNCGHVRIIFFVGRIGCFLIDTPQILIDAKRIKDEDLPSGFFGEHSSPLPPKLTEAEELIQLREDAKWLRKQLWLTHDPKHFSSLYGDDGEMQCARCMLDFRRNSIGRIKEVLYANTMRRVEEYYDSLPKDAEKV